MLRNESRFRDLSYVACRAQRRSLLARDSTGYIGSTFSKPLLAAGIFIANGLPIFGCLGVWYRSSLRGGAVSRGW